MHAIIKAVLVFLEDSYQTAKDWNFLDMLVKVVRITRQLYIRDR